MSNEKNDEYQREEYIIINSIHFDQKSKDYINLHKSKSLIIEPLTIAPNTNGYRIRRKEGKDLDNEIPKDLKKMMSIVRRKKLDGIIIDDDGPLYNQLDIHDTKRDFM
jgi:hypothetical protein